MQRVRTRERGHPGRHAVSRIRGPEGSGRIRRRVRRSEAEAAVRPARVVVGEVLAEDVLEVTPTEYERPVQALPPDGPHPPFGEGVRSRRPERGKDDLRAIGREDRIEAPGVLGVPIPEEEAKRTTPSQVEGEVAGLLVTQAEWGCLVAPAMWTRLVWTSITKNT